MRRTLAWVTAVAGLMALTAGCSTAPAPAVTPAAPATADFVFPAPPDRAGDQRLAEQHRRAWDLLQRGDARGSASEYSALLKRAPDYVAAQVGLGYALLAQRQFDIALARFDRVAASAPAYAPAQAGRGEVFLATGARAQAVSAFESAVKLAPGAADLVRKLEVARFTLLRELVATARKAADDGRLEDARQAYLRAIQSSPDSAVLLKDLALVELKLKADADAIRHLRQATALEPTDTKILVALAEALERQGDTTGALDAYERADRLEPSEATRKAVERLRDRMASTGVPAEFRGIGRLAQVTRGDLAALLGVRLQAWLTAHRRGSATLATDVRGHWAATYILLVVRAGLMDVFPNHTFQPGVTVKRVDAAQVVARVLAASAAGSTRTPPRPVMADMSPDHLGYADAAAAVASGIMPVLDGGQFRPSQILTGSEAVALVDRLERSTRTTAK